MRFAAKAALAALGLSVGAMAIMPAAQAIQTTTWGIQPSSVHGKGRGSLSYPSDGQTVQDSIIVYNRTGQPEVIDLSVLGATESNGAYSYSTQLAGLASRVTLAARQISLGPHIQAQVPVTIHLPAHSKVTTLAGIAAESAPVDHGSFAIEQRLVILVRATPRIHPAPLVPDLGLWGSIAGGVLALAAGLFGWEVRRRRRVAPGSVDDVRREMSRPHEMALR